MTKYVIEKHEQLNKYVVWKETETKRGFCIRGIFQGSRKQCEEFLDKIKKESN